MLTIPSDRSATTPRELVLVGSSPMMRAVREVLRMAAAVDFRVRIEGPPGTGKGVAAGLIHQWSRRRSGPFICQSLSSIPEGLEHARLCGWTRGAFTGAVGELPGVLEAAHGGTLFLDEVAIGSLVVQGVLLQLLEDRDVLRIGELRRRRVDVRFVFATNADLDVETREGRWRADLLARMGVLVIRMPELARHLDDLPELVESLLPIVAAEGRCPARALGAAEMEALAGHSWPGNVRELQSVLAHYLTFGSLPPLGSLSDAAALRQALNRHHWNKTRAGRQLGISRKAVNDRIRRFGLTPDRAAEV